MEATIGLEYWSVAKFTLQATAVASSYVQCASILYDLFDDLHTLIYSMYIHVNGALNCLENLPPRKQGIFLSHRVWMRDQAIGNVSRVLLVYQHSYTLVPCFQSLGSTSFDQRTPVPLDNDNGINPASNV